MPGIDPSSTLGKNDDNDENEDNQDPALKYIVSDEDQ